MNYRESKEIKFIWIRRENTKVSIVRKLKYSKITNVQRCKFGIHGPCIANTFAEYNQQDAKFHNLFISLRRSTSFRRGFLPSSGAQNCTYSVRYLSDQYLTLYVQFWVHDDGRKTRLKHVQRLTEINWEKLHLVGCTLKIHYSHSSSHSSLYSLH